MPTGYTACIEKGVSFKDFAMRCARAMGACITMRDDATDVPIPEKFESCSWYKVELKKAEQQLKQLKSISNEDAQKKADQEYEKAVVGDKKRIKKNAKVIDSYRKMLFKVNAWQLPTPEHAGLKKFMIEQIESSIGFDDMSGYYQDNPPKKLSGPEWLSQGIVAVEKDIKYYRKEHSEEVRRCKSRTAWVQALRRSLNEYDKEGEE